MQHPATPTTVDAFAVDSVEELIAELEMQSAGEIRFGGDGDNDPIWPSEVCTFRPTCVPR
jgi:hypothetical protein